MRSSVRLCCRHIVQRERQQAQRSHVVPQLYGAGNDGETSEQ